MWFELMRLDRWHPAFGRAHFNKLLKWLHADRKTQLAVTSISRSIRDLTKRMVQAVVETEKTRTADRGRRQKTPRRTKKAAASTARRKVNAPR